MEKAKNILLLFIIAMFLHQSTMAQPGFGLPEKLNNGWKFALSNDTTLAKPPANADWKFISLPHDWSVKQKLDPKNASSNGYLPGGIGWYKKDLQIPQTDKKIYIYFEGVYNRSEVFINGHSVGKRPNGYVSFMYDITPYIRQNQSNEIIVRVDHHRAADSRWYTGAGIYRDAWLVYANPVHIAEWGIYAYPEINGSQGTLNIHSEIKNLLNGAQNITLQHELIAPNGKVVGKTVENIALKSNDTTNFFSKIQVADPELWSINKPTLYKLKTSLYQDGKQIDGNVTTTGFRSYTFDPNKGFALNGDWMKVKGVCIHHDAGVLGAAMYKDVWRRRLLKLKELGVNAIRTSHNPQAPSLYDLCDELGFLVMDEAFDEWEYPKRKWLEGWNVGTPGFDGTYDFFESWGEKDLADMVRRDRNHLSVFAWSIGNEVDYPNDPYSHPVLDGSEESGFTQKILGGYKKDAPDAMRLGVIAKKLVAVVKEYDLSRPTTAGLAGVAMSNETEYPGALDIDGYNYTESRYKLDHEKYPNRVIYGSENRHDLNAWKAVTDNDFIFGQFLWTGIDYLGESGKWPSRGFYSGLVDFAGFIKPRGYFRESLWGEKPMAYIGTYPLRGRGASEDVLSQTEGNRRREFLSMDAWQNWNYKDGQTIRVVCYTNTEKARLLLNGTIVGEEKKYDTATGIIHWDIPFKDGELKVEGLDKNGNVAATNMIKTSGKSFAIKRIHDEYASDKDEIKQIAIQLVDDKGNPVHLAENEITVTVTGNLELLGLEAGNNTDMGNYTDNKQNAYRGRLIGYFKKKVNSQPVKGAKVSFASPGLEGFTVEF